VIHRHSKTKLRVYGKKPYSLAVVHGGPGAAGEMKPLAEALSPEMGILEPFQNAKTVDGQIEELSTILDQEGTPPLVLIGFSWGAWLCLMTTAFHPDLVKKLILVGGGPLDERYALKIHETRMCRLGPAERAEAESLLKTMNETGAKRRNDAFVRIGFLLNKADAFDPIKFETGSIEYRFDVFQGVWNEAEKLRRNGILLHLARHIKCPVTAFHGDYDPHPAEGIEKPLKSALKDFHFYLLRNCGHKPWIERQAMDEFYTLLRNELSAV